MTRLVGPLAAFLLAAGLVAAATPWRIPRAAVAEAMDAGLVGVRASLAGPATIKLLPRPRIQATQLSVAAENGAVALDAPLLKAELDIPSLLRGRWRITSATLVEPTATVDLDRLPRPAPSPGGSGAAVQLRIRSGVLRTRSADPAGTSSSPASRTRPPGPATGTASSCPAPRRRGARRRASRATSSIPRGR